MELPNIGGNCQWAGCNALDFLPFTCSFCSGAFCLAHFQVDSHECQNVAVAKPFEGRSGSKNSVCSLDGCITTDVVQMLCVKCHLHFCLKHRYHGCFKYSEEDIEEARRKINVPREQFAESLQKVSVRVEENIEKNKKTAKNRALALKVQLIRLKGKAKGDSNIPTADRIYFLIFPPLKSEAKSKAVYVSKQWAIGRVMDTCAVLCDVTNRNNVANASQLRLFRKSDGLQITRDMSVELSNLMETSDVVNGESLILEYIKPHESIQDFVITNPNDYIE